MKKHLYSAQFYKAMKEGSLASARAVCPIIMEHIDISSVLDLGCGEGTWLSAFTELGVEDVIGIDGPYVNRNSLLIDPSNFIPRDLKKPVNLKRKFDLAMSLEVAEHLPQKSAKKLVDSLCAHSEAVLFSAAVPGQSGTNHINCQWQSYWASLFKENGYVCVDFIRARIWTNEDVQTYYRQNMLLYLKDGTELLNEIRKKVECLPPLLDFLHPSFSDPKTCGIRAMMHMQAGIIKNIVPTAIRTIIKRL